MSVIALGATSRTHTTNGNVTKSLEIALSEFGSILTDEERKQLQQIKGMPDATAALVFTAKLDASNSTRRGKSIGARVYSMLQSIQQFSAVVDTFISANPNIAALVWGSIKLTILIASNITSYFESLADLFMGLNKLFPQFDEYQLLFPDSSALQESICIFHASVVQLCKQSILIIRQPWVKKMTTDLRGKLRPQVDNIHSCANNVKKTIDLAKAISDRKEQEFQEQERKLAAEHRTQLSIFTSRSQKVAESAREWQIQRDQKVLRKRRTKLLDSLSKYAYQKNFNQSRKKRHVNTATWLFSTPEFVQWKNSETPSVFILTGKLGSGKTVLTSSVIEQLCSNRETANELTTFVFPRFDDLMSLDAATVLRSVIRQCLQPDDVTGEIERQLSRLKNSNADVDTIITLLQHCTRGFSKLYIVIDALDEFEKEQRTILLQSLSSITSLPDSKARLFLVGRSSVSMEIRRWFPASQAKSADCRDIQADIETYTRETIALKQKEQLNPEEQLILQDPALGQEIIEALIDGADGMFLWVDYQITEICECTCDDEVREVLKTLPKNLGDTFDRATKRIVKRGHAKTASNIFQWAAATKRALTLDELREALSYEPRKSYSIVGKRPNGLERITAWCENLVQLDEELQIVQFAHRSVLQHFLEQPSEPSLQSFHINLDEADHFIGEICVTYLNSNDFKTDLVRNPEALPTQLTDYIVEEALKGKGVTNRIIGLTQRPKIRMQQKSTKIEKSSVIIKNVLEDPMAMLQLGHPFLEYASDYWLLHTRNFQENKSITWISWEQMIRGSHRLARTPWSPVEIRDRVPAVYEWIGRHDHFAVFLHVVSSARMSSIELIGLIRRFAALGRLKYMNILIDLANNREQLSAGLPYAARGGHLDVVQRLLDANANVNIAPKAENGGRTALQSAAEGGHLEIVQKLLDAKADVNAAAATDAENGGRTALQAAAEGGHLEVVQRLLNAKADVNAAAAADEIGGLTALQAAAKGGHLEVVQRLLDAGADVNAAAAKQGGLTALQAAAKGGHLHVVQRLLNAGADINIAAAESEGRTALQAAAEGGHLNIVQILLDAKAVVNAPPATTYRGRTALQAAAEGGNLDVVQILLDNGANVDAAAMRYSGMTALQAAAQGGHLKVIQRLLDAGADVNATAAEQGGLTALQAAAQGGHLGVVQMLLNAKADVNAAPGPTFGRTAIQAAAEGGHLEVIQTLLNAKAKVNAPPSEYGGRTALQAAAEGGYLEAVQRLLSAKANVNAPAGDNGKTALQAAAKGGHLDIIQKLLDAKADVNAPPTADWGLTALQAAAEGGYLEVVERLLKAGADVNTPAVHNGWTALQAAAKGGHLDVVQRLLDDGADVNANVKNGGRTAIQVAAEGGYLEVVERLLKAGADVNTPAAHNGWTALQAAAKGGHLNVVQRLLEAGAMIELNSSDSQGTTLHLAIKGGHSDVAELLESFGARELDEKSRVQKNMDTTA